MATTPRKKRTWREPSGGIIYEGNDEWAMREEDGDKTRGSEVKRKGGRQEGLKRERLRREERDRDQERGWRKKGESEGR